MILTSRVYDVVEETPLTHAVNLSNRLECKVLLKREDLQPVFSFKLRGAYNKMAHLSSQERWKGVVACSAGTSRRPTRSSLALSRHRFWLAILIDAYEPSRQPCSRRCILCTPPQDPCHHHDAPGHASDQAFQRVSTRRQCCPSWRRLRCREGRMRSFGGGSRFDQHPTL